MGCRLPLGLRRAAASLHSHTRWLWTGFSRADVSVAVQMAAGWALLLSLLSIESVSRELGTLGVSAALSVVLCGFYIQPMQGAAPASGVVAVLAAAVIGALGFIPTYAAYAANGGSYEGAGAAKGATLVAVGAVLAALLVIPRIRLSPLAFQAFNVAGYLLSLRLFATYWVAGPAGPIANPEPPNKLAYLLMFDVLFPLAAALPITALLLPVPASRTARAVFCKVVRGLGELFGGVVGLLLDEGSTPQAAPTAPPPPVDLAATAAAAPSPSRLQEGAAAVRKGIQGMGMLLMASFFEIDVYAAPRRLRAAAYKHATAHAAAAEACLSLALRWATATRRPLERGLCLQLAPQLRGVQAALSGLCEALASAVEQRAPPNAVVAALQQLEGSWQELDKVAAATVSTPHAAFSFAVMHRVLCIAAAKVRSMAPLVAEALEPLQPGAVAAVAAHFAASEWLAAPPQPALAAVLGEEEERALCTQALYDGASGQQGADAGGDGGPPGKGSPPANGSSDAAAAILPSAAASTGKAPAPADKAAHLSAEASPLSAAAPAVVSLSAAAAAPGGPLRWLVGRTSAGRVTLIPALHMLLAFAAAGALTVSETAFKSLGYKSYWVSFTVNSIFEKSAGRIRQRAANRILGTAMGAAWSCATIGVVTGVNGGSWENRPAKFVALVVMTSLWAAFIGLNRQRQARFSYAWTVSMVAFCVIVLEEFRATTSPWIESGWRMACVCIGVGIEAGVTSCIFPVTTADLELDQLLRALRCLARFGQGVAAGQAEYAAQNGADGSNRDGPSKAAAAEEPGKLPDAEDGDGSKHAGQAAAAEAAAAEAGLAGTAGEPGGPAPLAPQGAAAAKRRAQLQAQAQKVKKHAGRLLALSSDSMQGPVPALRRTRQRHQATAAAVGALLHIVDSLLLTTYSEELRDARLAASGNAGLGLEGSHPGAPPASRRLALAVGAQFSECVEGLCLVLTRQLPLAQALPALRALDGLLHQLAAAGGLEAEQLLQQAEAPPAQAHPNADEGATLEAPAATAGSPATLLPLTAAMLSAVPQLRALYISAATAVLPDGAAAARGVEELSADATASWRLIADAQQAALAARAQ